MEAAQSYPLPTPYFKRLSVFDWAYAILLAVGAGIALNLYGAYMDAYEAGFLVAAVPVFSVLGWNWKPLRVLLLCVALISLFSIHLYKGDLASAEKVFFLKYLISSQSAIMWMSALFFMATSAYIFAMFTKSDYTARVGSTLVWCAVAMGLIGMMVRWYESYLIGIDVGHIPISNLYEVFILFCMITSLLYLYYEDRYDNRQMGAFVLPVVSAAVGFLLWYTFGRQAYEIQPLVPALQSYWMKIHVPANFIGYGSFALSAMVGVAYLLAKPNEDGNQATRGLLWSAAGVLLFGVILRFAVQALTQYKGTGIVAVAATVSVLLVVAACRGKLAGRLPNPEMLDDVMYKAIALGFAFFTIATILGAMWAAEAWGGYWSWDPKETWALIVWLNYAAWLHIRLVKGLRGPILAWWSVVGLFVTLFAFLGVNMFLSGLHSYGTL